MKNGKFILCLLAVASIYRDKGDVAGSCRVLRQAVDSWIQLDHRWGLSAYDRKNELGVVQAELAKCARIS